jgi:hypothetical protein
MSDTVQHTHAGHGHRAVSPSLMCWSGGRRIALALGLAALLWGAVLWAIV